MKAHEVCGKSRHTPALRAQPLAAALGRTSRSAEWGTCGAAEAARSAGGPNGLAHRDESCTRVPQTLEPPLPALSKAKRRQAQAFPGVSSWCVPTFVESVINTGGCRGTRRCCQPGASHTFKDRPMGACEPHPCREPDCCWQCYEGRQPAAQAARRSNSGYGGE
jgi:hypothetical protein